ncbi:MAG TPA: response regulator [Aggregatilineales bacterium]|nr:response regulator [Aggregatilineales bacterium]
MASRQRLHSIIIDDDEASASVLETLLTHLQVDVTIINDTRNIEQVLHNVPHADIVFLDLEMPNINGYDVLNYLHKEPDFTDTKIVAYTTHISHMNTARQAGFDAFLGKPIDSRAFADNFERILEGESIWQ